MEKHYGKTIKYSFMTLFNTNKILSKFKFSFTEFKPKKIDVYITRKYLGTFFLSISLLLFIVIVFDISEKIDDFLETKVSINSIIFDYYLNFIPYFINQFSSLFAFIAVIFFTSRLASNTEVVAMLSNGISYNRFLRPYLFSAIVIALMSFFLGNFIIPRVNVKRIAFERSFVKSPKISVTSNIHLQILPGVFVYVQSFDSYSKTGYQFSLMKLNEGELIYKLDADRIAYDSLTQKWELSNYFFRVIDKKKEMIKNGESIKIKLNLTPHDFSMFIADYETMNFFELRKFIQKERLRGSDSVKFYEVEHQSRMAYPIATIILTIIGAITSSRKVRGGIGIHLGFGMLISFSFILFMKISTVFATSGNLSANVSVWIPNVIFGLLAIAFLRFAQK